MKLINELQLADYLENDEISYLLNLPEAQIDNSFTSQKWLLDSEPKRLIFHEMYMDLLDSTNSKKILDVGGGFCSLSRKLIKDHKYKLLDIIAHDDHALLNAVQQASGINFWINNDWYNYQSDDVYDLIIANDIFPNVDQRLGLFLEKYIPVAKTIKISLTYYNSNKFYKAKRIGADEIFFVLAWDNKQLQLVLDKYQDRIFQYNNNLFLTKNKSIFKNGRQVVIISLHGDR